MVFEQISTKQIVTEQVVPLRNQPKSSAFINRLKRTRGVAREPPESPERQAMDTAAGLAKASAKRQMTVCRSRRDDGPRPRPVF